MDLNNNFNRTSGENSIIRKSSAVQTFMGTVYAWMAAGLLITGAVAYFTAHSPQMLRMLFSKSYTVWILFAVQIGLVFALSNMIHKIRPIMAALGFIIYSACMGLTLSVIFLVYTKSSIASVFFITALSFTALSIFGIVTKRNLNGLGSFMFMGLVGIVIASVVNIFMKSEMIYWIVSYLGVFIFAGLTAYDTQKLKEMSYELDGNNEMAMKLGILGALTLYLDFVNMFLFLLRIFDRR